VRGQHFLFPLSRPRRKDYSLKAARPNLALHVTFQALWFRRIESWKSGVSALLRALLGGSGERHNGSDCATRGLGGVPSGTETDRDAGERELVACATCTGLRKVEHFLMPRSAAKLAALTLARAMPGEGS
jgi:hypothetical protein